GLASGQCTVLSEGSQGQAITECDRRIVVGERKPDDWEKRVVGLIRQGGIENPVAQFKDILCRLLFHFVADGLAGPVHDEGLCIVLLSIGGIGECAEESVALM